jgi:hypothetical protein
MSKLSRRSLVSSAATLPALAVPAVASALPAEGDLELKQLGVRLLKENRNFDALCADPNPDDEEVGEASGRIAALMPPIFSRTATTRDGLAVQAAAAAIACRELWDGVGDWTSAEDPSWQVERPFIEAVCRYTGVAHPAVTEEAEDTPQLVHSTKPDPIFAAIKAFESASDAHDEAFAVANEAADRICVETGADFPDVLKNDPAVKALDDAFERAAVAQATARDILLTTIPTTSEGLATLVAFVIGNEHLLLDIHEAADTSELVRFLTSVARSAFALAGLPARIGTPAVV